jgi:hypothetical protein
MISLALCIAVVVGCLAQPERFIARMLGAIGLGLALQISVALTAAGQWYCVAGGLLGPIIYYGVKRPERG